MIPDIEPSPEVDSDLEEEIKEIIQEWLEGKLDLQQVLNTNREDLKSDTSTDDVYDSNNNPNSHDEHTQKTVNAGDVKSKHVAAADGPPDDIRAFYGHPLTAATASINDADTHASAVALLHEYINLPALDRSGMKIGDKINSIYDIMRDDGSTTKSDVRNGVEGDYMQMLHTTLASEVDKFFNRNCGDDTTCGISDGDTTNVSVAEEVIHEVCVETTGLSTGTLDSSQIYSTSSDSIEQSQDSLIEADNSLLTIAMPSLEDFQNVAPLPACSASRMTPAMPPMPGRQTSRRPREPKEQSTAKQQDLSKKLVKALTEKILKRMNEKEQQFNEKTEIETAVSNLANASSAPASSSSIYSFPGSDTVLSNVTASQPHDVLVNLTDTLPVIQTSSLETHRIPVTQFASPDIPPHLVDMTTEATSVGMNSPTANNSQCILTNPKSVTMSNHNDLYHAQDLHDGAHPGGLTQVHGGKRGSYIRHNSVPVTNQNNFQTNASSIVSCAVINEVPPVYFYPDQGHVPYMYTSPERQLVVPTNDYDIMLQRYIQQKNSHVSESPAVLDKENTSLKSPDSGYAEPCRSPRDNTCVQYSDSGTDNEGENRGSKVAKRRKSAPPMYVKQYWHPLEKNSKPTVLKLDQDPAGYKYFLECPISTTQRVEEDRITYLNKGQYYGLTLEHDAKRQVKSSTVKSVIMVVFREDKHLDDERKAWEFWHSRQHSYKQRVIDIDTKNSVNVNANCTEEISYNAVAVRWDPRNSPAKVNIAIHCLSTDFSNQKGVKGLPLHVQIDTYENSTKDAFPISRGYCQIKVFCDKGAERKIRDEERRKQCRVNKTENQPATKAIRKRNEEVYHEALEKSEFYPMADLQTQPILFTPTFEGDESTRPSPLSTTLNEEDGSSSISSTVDHYDSSEDGPTKRPRTDSFVHYQNFSNILLYVREKHEVVFTAVMLRSPTVNGLLQAVEEKYNVPVSKIKNSYKRSKKGILVRMDDNIIRHYSHESTFIIELNQREDKCYELVLTEIDPS